MTQLTSIKNPLSYPKQVNDVIALLSVDPDNAPFAFGSYSYKMQPYPSDIDLQQLVIACSKKGCNKEQALKEITKLFQKTIKKVISTKGTYLGDVKAGQDLRFKIDIGEIKGNINKGYMIKGYNPNAIRIKLGILKKNGLLNNKDHLELMKLVKDKISIDNFNKLYDGLRKFWLLRWKKEELLKGYKILPGKVKIKLVDALGYMGEQGQENTDGHVKIDIWYPVNGRYLEITNFLILSYLTMKNNQKYINLDRESLLNNITDNLRAQVDKTFHEGKLFKMVKRLWSIARLTNDEDILLKTTPLLISNVGILSQIASEIETIVMILQNVKNPPIATLLKQIDNFKGRIANVFEFNLDDKDLYVMVNLIESIKKPKLKMNKLKIIEILEKLQDYLKEIVKEQSKDYLKKNGLYPPPSNYLPN